MKKAFSLLLAAVLMLSLLAGCVSDNGETSQTTAPTATTLPAPTQTDAPGDDWITVAEALAMPLEEGEETEERYFLHGTVDSIQNSNYGAMYICDETGSIYVYGSYSEDGSLGYAEMDEKPYKGAEVTIYGTIQNYNGAIEIKNAWIISFTPAKIDYDESAYPAMSIADARAAEEGSKMTVTGVVAQITYANGKIPSGFILADSTSSIYVYSGDIAAQVAEGSTVTLAASKTWWILEDEQQSAAAFGYKGCSQLENAILVDYDETAPTLDTSWIQETTVKAIMDTPASENITSQIFKVTALVKKLEGTGFTNYYINDLDGATGSYTYTQCSGGDFAWLDEFDGKICTVYLVVLNAKSTSAGCVWRFLPVEVIDEGFDVSTVNVAEHIVKYYGIPQLQSEYTGDPALALTATVDSELLNFSGASLTYASDNTNVITVDGGVMHCLAAGTAEITVTGTYGDQTYSETVTVTVSENADVEYISVTDAIAATVGETVTVKGIVGPSLVNRTGFYLIDNQGIIAIITDEATMQTLSIGDEIILQGLRDKFHNGEGNHAGQTALTNCSVVANYYGDHDYCTDFFVTDKTLADFYALDVSVDYSTTVFVLKATVDLVETNYYTKIQLTDGSTTVSLYCSSANQYGWLKAYAGQEVTLEVAACNWNNKTYWTGCVLAVLLEDGKVVNELNFS